MEKKQETNMEIDEAVKFALTNYIGTVLQVAKEKGDKDGGRPDGIVTADDGRYAVGKIAKHPELLEPLHTIAANAIKDRAKKLRDSKKSKK